MLKADVNAGPNARRFISRPTEHPSSSHPPIVKDLKLTKVVPQKRKANESGQLTLAMRKENEVY